LKQPEQSAGRFRSPKNGLVFHENTIREFQLSSKGVEVGRPLSQFRGLLTGVPIFPRRGIPLPDGGESNAYPDQRDTHVLLLMPTGRDAEMTAAYLGEAGIRVNPCSSIDELCLKVLDGQEAERPFLLKKR